MLCLPWLLLILFCTAWFLLYLSLSVWKPVTCSSLLLVLLQPLGRLGAKVLGIDPVENSIGTAQLHSSFDPDLCERVSYQVCTLEELSGGEEDGTGHFDAVVASEVVEHLADVETFAFCCSQVLKVLCFFVCFFLVFSTSGWIFLYEHCTCVCMFTWAPPNVRLKPLLCLLHRSESWDTQLHTSVSCFWTVLGSHEPVDQQ